MTTEPRPILRATTVAQANKQARHNLRIALGFEKGEQVLIDIRGLSEEDQATLGDDVLRAFYLTLPLIEAEDNKPTPPP